MTKPITLPFRETFWPDKWGIHEEYGGPNFGEKEFQLFQLFIDKIDSLLLVYSLIILLFANTNRILTQE